MTGCRFCWLPLFSGQAPVLYVFSLVSCFFVFSPIWIRFQMPQPIDVDTPQSALTRKGFDGFDYEIVFSDEFNTPGRTFYPGLLSYYLSFFTFVNFYLSFRSSFHDSMTTFNLAVYIPPPPHWSYPLPLTHTFYSGGPPLPFPSFYRPIFFFAIFGSFVCSLPPCHLPCQEYLVGIFISYLRNLSLACAFLSSVFCSRFYLLGSGLEYFVFFPLIP